LGPFEIDRQLDAAGPPRYLAYRRLAPQRKLVLSVHDLDNADGARLSVDLQRARRVGHSGPAVAELTVEAGQRILAIERLEGLSVWTLSSYLEGVSERLADAAVCKIGCELMEAVAAAHGWSDEAGVARPLVHGMLGPKQIYIEWDGTVRVLGFGLVALYRLAPDPPWDEGGAFLAPEVRAGRMATPRADVYSAARILWGLFTQRRTAVDQEPQLLGKVRPELDARLVKSIERALEPNSANRTITCRELADQLEAHADPLELEWNMELLRAVLPVGQEEACAEGAVTLVPLEPDSVDQEPTAVRHLPAHLLKQVRNPISEPPESDEQPTQVMTLPERIARPEPIPKAPALPEESELPPPSAPAPSSEPPTKSNPPPKSEPPSEPAVSEEPVTAPSPQRPEDVRPRAQVRPEQDPGRTTLPGTPWDHKDKLAGKPAERVIVKPAPAAKPREAPRALRRDDVKVPPARGRRKTEVGLGDSVMREVRALTRAHDEAARQKALEGDEPRAILKPKESKESKEQPKPKAPTIASRTKISEAQALKERRTISFGSRLGGTDKRGGAASKNGEADRPVKAVDAAPPIAARAPVAAPPPLPRIDDDPTEEMRETLPNEAKPAAPPAESVSDSIEPVSVPVSDSIEPVSVPVSDSIEPPSEPGPISEQGIAAESEQPDAQPSAPNDRRALDEPTDLDEPNEPPREPEPPESEPSSVPEPPVPPAPTPHFREPIPDGWGDQIDAPPVRAVEVLAGRERARVDAESPESKPSASRGITMVLMVLVVASCLGAATVLGFRYLAQQRLKEEQAVGNEPTSTAVEPSSTPTPAASPTQSPSVETTFPEPSAAPDASASAEASASASASAVAVEPQRLPPNRAHLVVDPPLPGIDVFVNGVRAGSADEKLTVRCGGVGVMLKTTDGSWKSRVRAITLVCRQLNRLSIEPTSANAPMVPKPRSQWLKRR
jgi:hypothetical protein